MVSKRQGRPMQNMIGQKSIEKTASRKVKWAHHFSKPPDSVLVSMPSFEISWIPQQSQVIPVETEKVLPFSFEGVLMGSNPYDKFRVSTNAQRAPAYFWT